MAAFPASSAVKYLQDTGVQEKLTAAIVQTLRERPDDAAARIAELLQAPTPPTAAAAAQLPAVDQADVEAAFASIAGASDVISPSDFAAALKSRTKTSLKEPEIQRVWDVIAQGSAELRVAEFAHAVERVPFLCQLVSTRVLLAETGAFDVPASYDFTKKTNEAYSVGEDRTFRGRYADVRGTINYKFHVNYTAARQAWQDFALDTVVARTAPHASPLILFSCGPMGVGKGYVISWMSEHGFLPLEQLAVIDPDHFKTMMPEWECYVSAGSNAGSLTHDESGFLMEVAQEAAMRTSQHVFVDGSLRNAKRFTKVFTTIRKNHPQYTIGIIEVGATEEIVRERVQRRAEETGRAVPEKELKDSLESVPTSMHALSPLVDFVVRVDNQGEGKPVLKAVMQVSGEGTAKWGTLQQYFR